MYGKTILTTFTYEVAYLYFENKKVVNLALAFCFSKNVIYVCEKMI